MSVNIHGIQKARNGRKLTTFAKKILSNCLPSAINVHSNKVNYILLKQCFSMHRYQISRVYFIHPVGMIFIFPGIDVDSTNGGIGYVKLK